MFFSLVGIIGSCAASLAAKDFLPVAEVLASMEPEKKEILSHNVRRIMTDVNVTDVAPFAALIAGEPAIRRRVVGELVNYLTTEMSMAVAGH